MSRPLPWLLVALLLLAPATALQSSVPAVGDPGPVVPGLNADFLDGLSSENITLAVDTERADRTTAMASEHAERVGEEAALHEGIDVVHAEVDGQIYSIAQMQTAVAQHETDIRDHELRLQAETQARTAGDAAAADALTAEATARAQSDQALDARLTTVESAHPLRVEAFTAHLANAADFVAPTDHVATTLAYTDVVQNTAPDVFTLSPSGGITFQKTGVVTITAHLLVIATDPFAQVEAHVNGAEISRTLARSADSTTYAEVANTLTWKVNAGDTIDFRAYPDQVLLTENGPWSTVTASWTG